MTAPALPLTSPAPQEPRTPLGVAKATGRTVSPYYYNYLSTQVNNIQMLAQANGENADNAIKAFLALEERKPFSRDPDASRLGAQYTEVPSQFMGVPLAVLNGVTLGLGAEGIARLQGAISGLGARASFDAYKEEWAKHGARGALDRFISDAGEAFTTDANARAADFQASYDAWRAANSKTALAGEVAGSLLPALATGGGSVAAGAAMKIKAIPFIAKSVLWGAASGAGNAQSTDPNAGFLRIDDRLHGALFGAGAAGVTGAGIAGVGKFIAAPAARAIANTAAGRKVIGAAEDAIAKLTHQNLISVTPEAKAYERMVRVLLDAGVTADDAARTMREMLNDGVAPNVVAIGGRGMQELVAEAMRQVSPRTAAAFQQLQSELAGQPNLAAALSAVAPRRLGLAHANDLISMLEEEARIRSEPLRRAAYEKTVQVTPLMRRMFKKFPELLEAYNDEAAQVAKDTRVGLGFGLPVTALPTKASRKAAAKAATVVAAARRTADAAQRELSAARQTAANAISVEARNAALARIPELEAKFNAADKAFRDINLKTPAATPGATLFPSELPIRGIDGMKKRLDAIIEKKFAAAAPTKDAIAKAAKVQKRDAKAINRAYSLVVEEAKRQNEDFKQALLAYGGPARLAEHIKMGETLWSKEPRAITAYLKNLNPLEVDMVRAGYARKAYTAMAAGDGTQSNLIAKFLGGGKFQDSPRAQQIRALFPGNPSGADYFLRNALGQAQVVDGMLGVSRGAQRTANAAAERAAEGPISIRAQAGLTLASAAEKVASRFRTHMTQEEADEIAHIALKTSLSPDALETLLNRLFAEYAGLVGRAKLAGGVPRQLGQHLGAAVAR